jgi:hypothetical protein
MGAMINTNRSVVKRLQQIMCSQKIYGGVVIRQLQIMCSNKKTVPKIMCSQNSEDIWYKLCVVIKLLLIMWSQKTTTNYV